MLCSISSPILRIGMRPPSQRFLETARSASLRLFHALEDILRAPESYHGRLSL
ncbi:MAG TPA: hypothetical protein PK530_08280 [Anaerolineales bacterium]|nr:hypothetical protein [Anaerolineales bacterium]